ncbi:conserved hypothetical protein [Alkaliphilus metalliredigens QYMF]|uniref:Uncharacterized protein n=1 Tax=Alkaliphilus metalliredigens (strain QYMF) TaxID=293826 RepID=A6TJM8_ALKMQ|nr:hypothetical protein [Alkaliphilus metalliredigens]ABR46396.1 conserved hypothetical protein [Alkaliphilus metalliredigens QYMF]
MGIIAGIIAALLAYLLNKWALKGVGERGLIALVPFIEEAAKSGVAFLLKTSFIQAHFVFGCVEGVYDMMTSSKKIGKWAALASILSHSFFGGITYFVYTQTQALLLSIMAAWIFHSGWNWYITKYL